MTSVSLAAPLDATSAGDPRALVARKGAHRVSVCIPARNEEMTVGAVAIVAAGLVGVGLVDEVVVVDDGSTDATASAASAAGATVVSSPGGPGKGQAMRAALEVTTGDIVVFVDADVSEFSHRFISGLVAPLLMDPLVQLAKASYRRPLDGAPGEGGRVTELLARPLLRRFFPDLADVGQPLAGECAVRRDTLEVVNLADGYGIEIGLLIDVFRLHGRDAIVDVDLGVRTHRNRPLHELRPHADEVLAALVARLGCDGSLR